MPNRIFQIVAGVSLNGKIADQKGSFKLYSSPEDQAFLQEKIQESDVLIMGRKTYEQHSQFRKKPVIIFTREIKGMKVVEGNLHFFNDTIQELINLLDLLQYRKVTILGGADIYRWFIDSGLVTEVFLTVEPHIINKGKNLLSGTPFSKSEKWKLNDVKPLNEKKSLLLHYTVL